MVGADVFERKLNDAEDILAARREQPRSGFVGAVPQINRIEQRRSETNPLDTDLEIIGSDRLAGLFLNRVDLDFVSGVGPLDRKRIVVGTGDVEWPDARVGGRARLNTLDHDRAVERRRPLCDGDRSAECAVLTAAVDDRNREREVLADGYVLGTLKHDVRELCRPTLGSCWLPRTDFSLGIGSGRGTGISPCSISSTIRVSDGCSGFVAGVVCRTVSVSDAVAAGEQCSTTEATDLEKCTSFHTRSTNRNRCRQHKTVGPPRRF